jgi:hypothetical protein
MSYPSIGDDRLQPPEYAPDPDDVIFQPAKTNRVTLSSRPVKSYLLVRDEEQQVDFTKENP